MPRLPTIQPALLVLWAMGLGVAWGHVVQPNRSMHASTILEMFVEDEGIRLELELISEDWVPFSDWLPAEAFAAHQVPVPQSTSAGLAGGVGQGLRLTLNGEPTAKPELRSLSLRNRTPRDGADGMPLPRPQDNSRAAQVYAAEFWIPFATQPELIRVEPPSREAFPKLELGFRAHHGVVEANAFNYLRAPATLLLDWEDSWRTRFAEPFLVRAFHDSMDLRVYVGEREVRLEAAVRVLDFRALLDLPEADLAAAEASPEARRRMLDRLAAALALRIQLMAEGESLVPSSVTVRGIRRSLSGLRQVAVNEPEPLHRSVAGIVWSFPVPASLETTYRLTTGADLFSTQVQRIPITWEAAGNQRLEAELGPDLRSIDWRPLRRAVAETEAPASLPVPPETHGLALGIPWAVVAALLAAPILAVGLALRRAPVTQRFLAWLLWVLLLAGGGMISGWAGPQVTLGEPPMAQAPPYAEAEAKEVCIGLIQAASEVSGGDSAFAGTFQKEGQARWNRALPSTSPFGGTWDGRKAEIASVRFPQRPDTRRIVAEVDWTDQAWSTHWQLRHEERRSAHASVTIVPEAGAWRIGGVAFR